MKLRPYQLEALQRCREAHQRAAGSRVLIQFPTGTGKTEVAAQAAVGWVLSRPYGRAVVAVPSAPILAQFYRRLVQLTRLPVEVEKATARASSSARIVVASQASLWGRLGRYDRETLLLYDECHHSNLDAPRNLRVASSFRHVVGFSATPWTLGCEKLFAKSERVSLALTEAQRLGLVAPLEIQPWREPRGPWGLVFCEDNASCARRAAALPGSSWVGVDSGEVTARIAAWRAGAVPVLFANRMLVEGFDEPRCAEVWLAKETDSDILYAQMAGRALRPRAGKAARVYCETAGIAAGLRAALARCG